MHLGVLDWAIVACYLGFCLWVGWRFSGKAGKDMESYFLSGRNLPWWIVGTSMVATTFASDTPLAITEFFRNGGIWKNWFWWAMAMGSGLSIFLWAPLWRRVGVITDNEMIELRYEGKPAAFLRGFKAIYFSVLYNMIVMGWVIKGMVTVIAVLLGIPEVPAIALCLIVALAYTFGAGFWGVVVTDLLQFAVAMVGSICLAVFAINYVGGVSEALTMVRESPAFRPETLHFLPPMDLSSIKTPFSEILIYACMLWWCTHSSDGGGYLIQRMMAAKDEKHATAGTLWFFVAHYALRIWPWIMVAMVSMILFPDLSTHAFKDKAGYPLVMQKVLPAGLMGVMVAYFVGAFMSTIDTHVNWGTSYIINDIYKRFIRPGATDRHYVLVARLASVVVAAMAGYVAFTWIDSISKAWQFITLLGSGIGLVLMTRWFWWRVNAYSEISALATSLVLTFGWIAAGKLFPEAQWLGYSLASTPFHAKLLFVVPVCMAVWIPVTFLTKPVSKEKLKAFYDRARPGGFWEPVVGKQRHGDELFGKVFFARWLGALCLIFGTLFGLGNLLFLRWGASLAFAAMAGAGVWILIRSTAGWEKAGARGA